MLAPFGRSSSSIRRPTTFEALGIRLVIFDQLDLITMLDLLGESPADIAAATQHDALHGLVHAAQLAQDPANVPRVRYEKHFIACLHHGIALRNDGTVLAEYRGDTSVDLRHVSAQMRNRVPDERTTVKCLYGNEADATFGELQHLQSFGKLEELGDIV